MLAKMFPTFLLLFFVVFTVFAQLPADEQAVADYRQAEAAMILLRNQGDLAPLRRLDTLRVAYYQPRSMEDDQLLAYLEKYTVIQPWNEKNQDADLLIIGLGSRDMVSSEWRAFREKWPQTKAAVKTAVVWLGNPALLAGVKEAREADVLLASPGPASFASVLAAQALFGAVGVHGKLEQAISNELPEGAGLDLEPIQRLGYAPPAIVGMNTKVLEEGIAAIVQEGLDAQAFPGAQVLVAKDGKVVYHHAFGYFTYDQERPVELTDLYDYASVTKVTSTLPVVMKLYGEGQFELDAPLSRYYPGLKGSNKADLSYRSVLGHHARLRAWIPYWGGALKGNAKYPWQKKWDPERINDYRFRSKTFARDSSALYPIRLAEDLWQYRDYKKQMFKAIRKSPLNENPGYLYSGLLFYLLPDIVADLTKADFETYLDQTFYHRLGAYTITYNPLRTFPQSRIVPMEKDTFFSMQQIHGRVHDEGAAMMGGVSGNAGLFSDANDLAKLFQMYMNKGSYGGEQYITREAVDEFIRCQYCAEGNHRGLGFDKPLINYDSNVSSVAKDAGPDSFGHSGYTGTFVWADPDKNLLYIFFSNRVYPTRNNRKLYELAIRPRIHQVLYDAIKQEAGN